MHVALQQFTPMFGDVEVNRERLVAAIERAATEPLDLVVSPELAITGYRFVDRDELARLAEPIPGPTTEALAALAARHDLHLVTGLAERDGDRLYNAAAVVGPGGVVGSYRKVHLFGPERGLFDAGDAPWPVFDVAGARVGVMICFDWCFPEAARSLALGGAQLIALPANLVLPHGQTAMVTRSIENRVFAVVANRGGCDARDGLDPIRFTGQSRIIGPGGELLADVTGDLDTIRVVEIEPTLADVKRVDSGNDLFAERRPDLYGAITRSVEPPA